MYTVAFLQSWKIIILQSGFTTICFVLWHDVNISSLRPWSCHPLPNFRPVLSVQESAVTAHDPKPEVLPSIGHVGPPSPAQLHQ